MTEDEAHIFCLALLTTEETMNEVITTFAEDGRVLGSGEALIAAISLRISKRSRELVETGEGDALLAIWRSRRRMSFN